MDGPRSVADMSAPRSEATNALRRRIKTEIEDQIWDFFTVQGGQVVIYDANNGNVKARKECVEKFESKGVHVIFLGKLANGWRSTIHPSIRLSLLCSQFVLHGSDPDFRLSLF
jgi:6-phosphofructo-2-kinase/fructose-2,6-biphosphatase 4